MSDCLEVPPNDNDNDNDYENDNDYDNNDPTQTLLTPLTPLCGSVAVFNVAIFVHPNCLTIPAWAVPKAAEEVNIR